MEKYKAVVNYKENLVYDAMKDDELFDIWWDIDDPDFHGIMINSAPVRGEFELTPVPYGFYLYGYGGESLFMVLSSTGQNGTVKIAVTNMEPDGGCRVLTETVKWKDELVAVNDMINRLYFHYDQNNVK